MLPKPPKVEGCLDWSAREGGGWVMAHPVGSRAEVVEKTDRLGSWIELYVFDSRGSNRWGCLNVTGAPEVVTIMAHRALENMQDLEKALEKYQLDDRGTQEEKR